MVAQAVVSTVETIILFTNSDGERLEAVPSTAGYSFRVGAEEPGDDDEEATAMPVIFTASEWCAIAIEVLLKVPGVQDHLGLVSAELRGPLTVVGRARLRRSWRVEFTEIGSSCTGEPLLEWSASRPLLAIEIAAAFKLTIKHIGAMSNDGGW